MFQQFDRLILAEEIRTCATTKPNPELTPTKPKHINHRPLGHFAEVLVSGAGEWAFLGEMTDAKNFLDEGVRSEIVNSDLHSRYPKIFPDVS